jgi:starvation-inducible DNA-binding protein
VLHCPRRSTSSAATRREEQIAMQETQTVQIGVPGVAQGVREALIGALNQSLANLTDLATAYKQAHWNVVGRDFSQLHELFDTFTDQTREYADLVAERAVTLGGVADGTIQAAVERTELPPFPRRERDERRLVEELVARVDGVAGQVRAAMDGSAEEPATQDLFTEVLRGIEKQRWMLAAHLERTR